MSYVEKDKDALVTTEPVARLLNLLLAWLGAEKPEWLYVHEALHAAGLDKVTPEMKGALTRLGYDRVPSPCPAGGGELPGFRRRGEGIFHREALAVSRQRLQSLVAPAIKKLRLALKAGKTCEACGGFEDPRQAAVVLKAAQLVLDRTGFGPTAKLEVEAAPGGWARYLTDEQLATVAAWIVEAKERAAAEEGE